MVIENNQHYDIKDDQHYITYLNSIKYPGVKEKQRISLQD